MDYLNDYQIRELINKALQGMIDKNDLTGTEKAHVLHHAERAKIKELQFIHELLLSNPDKTFDELVSTSVNYKDCLKIINWLSQDQEQILSGASSQQEPEPDPDPDTKEEGNPHPRIFTTVKAWQFFQHLKDNFVTNDLADYSYIFHKMKSDGFLFNEIKHLEFIDWLKDAFSIELNATQLKSYYNSTNKQKEKNYTFAKHLFR